MRRILAVGLVAFGLFSASASHAARLESARYELGVAGFVGVTVGPTSCERSTNMPVPLNRNIAAACFDVRPGEASITATIADDLASAVGLSIEFPGLDGIFITDGCNSLTVPIPAGATRVIVRAAGPADGSLSCETLAAATSGTISATFA